MYNRGIRGAITVELNDEKEILTATTELLNEMIARNELDPELIGSVFITMTTDLNAAFPAKAVRQLPGWDYVPLMCATEIPVQGSLPRCIRVMVQVNTDKAQREMNHVYLRRAQVLRTDLGK